MWKIFPLLKSFSNLFSTKKDKEIKNKAERNNMDVMTKMESHISEYDASTSRPLTTRSEFETFNELHKPEVISKFYENLSIAKTEQEAKYLEELKIVSSKKEALSQSFSYGSCLEKPKVEAKYHRCKVSPNYSIYLQKVDEIPPYYLKCGPRFLSKNEFERVVIASYPRSGTTLLRRYIEEITKVITGSDSDLRRKLVKELKDKGMHGEGKTGSNVWVVKTNFPERLEEKQFKCHKCILLVRNPIDAIASLFHLNSTVTLDKSISYKDMIKHEYIYNKFYEREINIWTQFHEFWFKKIAEDFPVLIVRYEDLLFYPEKVVKDLIMFLTNSFKEDINNSLIEKMAQEVLESSFKPTLYQPRKGIPNSGK